MERNEKGFVIKKISFDDGKTWLEAKNNSMDIFEKVDMSKIRGGKNSSCKEGL